MPLPTGSWRCCSGHGSTTALGMRVTCECAEENDELDVLRWAIENGCPGGERYAHHLT